MPTGKIFISYSRSDTATAVKIANQLRSEGADVWVDKLDIPPGNMWDFEIEKALEKCTCLLFISSKISVASENVMNEVSYALDEKIRIVPIKIDDCKIPLRIRRLQYIDLSANYEEGFRSLLSVLNLDKNKQANKRESTSTYNASTGKDINEEELWGRTRQSDTIEAYQNYIKAFPAGINADKAFSKIKQYELIREEKLWEETRLKNTPYAYQNYLKETRLKNHIDEANKRLGDLERPNSTRQEEGYWKSAKEANSISSYQNYLNKYANGTYRNQALTAIKNLQPGSKDKSKNFLSGTPHFKLYIGGGILVLLVIVYFLNRNGNIDSAYQKGLEYSSVNNYPLALENFEISANSGHSGAMLEMAKIYLKGNNSIAVNINESIKWFTKAHEAGNKDAMFLLGNFFHNSDNTTKDNSKAFDCYLKAAEAGNKDAMLLVSDMYFNGEGVDKDTGKGNFWRGKANE